MKSSKNIFAFAICLAMYCPVKCEESTEDTHRLTNQQETILNEVVSVAAESAITALANAINTAQTQHPISLEQACDMLQTLMDNLVDGSTFEINDVKYVIGATQKNIIIDNQSVATDVQIISQEDAITLLQEYAKNFENETAFCIKSSILFSTNDTNTNSK